MHDRHQLLGWWVVPEVVLQLHEAAALELLLLLVQLLLLPAMTLVLGIKQADVLVLNLMMLLLLQAGASR